MQGWPTDHQVLEDLDFILRLCNCGRTILILEPLTIFYRRHAANILKNKCVPLYILAVYKLIGDERSGKYPGGKRRRFERQALIGGMVLRCVRSAAKAGLYGAALKLLVRGWPMAMAIVTRKLGVRLRRRQGPETMEMPMGWSSSGQRP
jgi:hypothetical protein